MDKEKYFTPEIEDFCAGYEFEFLESGYSYPVQLLENNQVKLLDNPVKTDVWKKEKYTPKFFSYPDEKEEDGVGNNLKHYIDTQQIRVPFLTKEQIEAEGWQESDVTGFFNKINDIKDRWYINWIPAQEWLNIGDNENDVDYAGPCKDINTFRKIVKLLNIK